MVQEEEKGVRMCWMLQDIPWKVSASGTLFWKVESLPRLTFARLKYDFCLNFEWLFFDYNLIIWCVIIEFTALAILLTSSLTSYNESVTWAQPGRDLYDQCKISLFTERHPCDNPVAHHLGLPPPLVVIEPWKITTLGHALETDTPVPQLWPPGIHDCTVTKPRALPYHQPCGHLAQVCSHPVFGHFQCSMAHSKANYRRF